MPPPPIAPSAPAAMCARLADGAAAARPRRVRSLAAEYALNWQLECFIKPTVSLIDGVVMGSGVGISLYGTHRVAGERYRFAMPETGIGLFPGRRRELGLRPHARRDRHVSGADGPRHRAGRCLPARAGDALHPGRALRRDSTPALADADPVDPLLDDRHEDPGPGELEALRPVIARCFCADTVEGIVDRLRAERGRLGAHGRKAVAGGPVARARRPRSRSPTGTCAGARARPARHA